MIDPDCHYTWPTRMRARALLGGCTPFNKEGGFRAAVEVVIYPKGTRTGYTVLSSREYLEKGPDVDRDAAAVRFNTDTIVEIDATDQRHADPFSVIWVAGKSSDVEAAGEVHLIGPSWITAIMRDMVEKSATTRVSFDSVLESGERLNGHDASSTLPPALTDTGLVKSVSIPPGRLRVVSRLEDELLKHRKKLTHEVTLAATVPTALNEAAGLEFEIAVFPKGWVKLRSDSVPSADDLITLPVPADWGRPLEGRTGLGSRYVFETVVARTRVGLASNPPPARRPPSGRRGAEVRIRVLRGEEELCRLHHPFWIEPREPTRGSIALAEELQQLLNLLSDADIARATKVSVDTVRAWLKDEDEPSSEAAERINELMAVVDRLASVVSPDFIDIWLRRPLRILGDEKPLDLLARGAYKEVSRVVGALESPVAS